MLFLGGGGQREGKACRKRRPCVFADRLCQQLAQNHGLLLQQYHPDLRILLFPRVGNPHLRSYALDPPRILAAAVPTRDHEHDQVPNGLPFLRIKKAQVHKRLALNSASLGNKNKKQTKLRSAQLQSDHPQRHSPLRLQIQHGGHRSQKNRRFFGGAGQTDRRQEGGKRQGGQIAHPQNHRVRN